MTNKVTAEAVSNPDGSQDVVVTVPVMALKGRNKMLAAALAKARPAWRSVMSREDWWAFVEAIEQEDKGRIARLANKYDLKE